MSDLSDRSVARLVRVLEEPEVVGGRYEIAEQLGRGGMGAVYRARDTLLGRDVALKVLHLEGSPQLHQRLLREARVLAQLEHPGVVPVYDAGVMADGRVFYVMQCVRGRRLDDFARGGATRGELLRTFLHICDTVSFAHDRGIIHRDLKPGNVMIGAFGAVLVLDWGVAKLVAEAHAPAGVDERRLALSRDVPGLAEPNEPVTAEGTVLGTPGYMPPEQATGLAARVDQRADVFALGVILRDLLAAAGSPTPRALASIIATAAADDPSARYASAGALAEDLRRWLDGDAVRAHQEGWAERTLRLFRRHQTAILLILGYALVRLAILLWRGI